MDKKLEPADIRARISEQKEYITGHEKRICDCEENIRTCQDKIMSHSRQIDSLQRDVLHWKYEIDMHRQTMRKRLEDIKQLEAMLE